MLAAPHGWAVTTVTLWDAERRPEHFRRQVLAADIVHWMLHRTVLDPPAWNSAAVNLCSVHHVEDYETEFDYLSRCDGIVVHAEIYRDRLRAEGISEAAILCIPQPVEAAFFAGGRKRLNTHVRAAVPSQYRIGFFSTAEYGLERKGIDLLPQVLTQLSKARHRYALVVTGFGWRQVLQRPEFVGLPIQVAVAPSYFDMPRLYSTLTAYLCLSRIEGGPMPVFEAAASGVPIISTRVGRVPELARSQQSYVEIPLADPSAAARALVACVEDPETHRGYAVRAYETAFATLSVESYQRRHYDFYSKLTRTPWAPALQPAHRIHRMKRKWRAADSIYFGKRLWVDGNRPRALGLVRRGLLLDPLCAAFWGSLVRCASRGET